MSVIVSQAPAAAVTTVASAATSATSQVTVFNVIAGEPGAGAQLALNAPGTNRINGQRFQVLASGLVVLAAGTYTATVQPLIYASISAGFTASAAAAIVSAAAFAVTVASASAKNVPWSIEVDAEGDSTSGLLCGRYSEDYNNGAAASVATATIVNPPTSIVFSTEPALQFSFGVTVVGAVNGSTLSLSQSQLLA